MSGMADLQPSWPSTISAREPAGFRRQIRSSIQATGLPFTLPDNVIAHNRNGIAAPASNSRRTAVKPDARQYDDIDCSRKARWWRAKKNAAGRSGVSDWLGD